MGIILGSGLFVGVLIGVLISTLTGCIAILKTKKLANHQPNVWKVFCSALAIFLPLLLLAVRCYPLEHPQPGSDYDILLKVFFLRGVGYSAVPGIAALLAFLTAFLCCRNLQTIVQEVKSATTNSSDYLKPLLFLLVGLWLGWWINGLQGFNLGDLKAGFAFQQRKAMLAEARALFDKGNFTEAARHYSHAIESGLFSSKELGRIYVSRGWCNNRLGDYEYAAADFDRALQLNPKDAAALNGRGWANLQQEKYSSSITDFDAAIKLSPKYAMVYNNRGVAYKDMGMPDRARQDYRQSIRLNNDPEAKAFSIINLGWMEYMEGRPESAIAHCNQGLEILPNHAMGYNDRGAILEDMGLIDEALTDYARAIELKNDPEAEAYARINRALAKFQKADYAPAEQDLVEVIRRNLPMKEEAAVWLFITLRESHPDAQQRMAQLVPEIPLQDWPAMALGLFSNRVSMVEFLRSYWHTSQARRLRREAQAYFYAGQQWLYLGQPGEARDCFQRCIQLGIKDLNEYRMAKLRMQQIEFEKTEKGS